LLPSISLASLQGSVRPAKGWLRQSARASPARG